jgi:hypothetical protein
MAATVKESPLCIISMYNCWQCDFSSFGALRIYGFLTRIYTSHDNVHMRYGRLLDALQSEDETMKSRCD